MVRRKATSFGSMNITRVASAGHKNAPILQSLQKKKLTHVIGQAPGLDLPVLRYYCNSENDSGNTIVKDSI